MSILLNKKKPEKGVLMEDFAKIIKTYDNCLKYSELFTIYREIDLSNMGLLNYEEILIFFDKHKTSESNLLFYLVWLGKYLQS
jgi:hypothetical protein